MKRFFPIAFLILFSQVAKAGDIITLTNQMVFSGKVKKVDQCMVSFRAEGKTYLIPGEDIHSIVFEDPNDKVLHAYQELSDPDKCMKARTDADLYHGKVGGHIALGILFGPFAVIGAAISNPKPLNGKDTYMMSKNKEIFDDPAYLSCYRKKAKGQNVGNTAIGWGAWVLFILLL